MSHHLLKHPAEIIRVFKSGYFGNVRQRHICIFNQAFCNIYFARKQIFLIVLIHIFTNFFHTLTIFQINGILMVGDQAPCGCQKLQEIGAAVFLAERVLEDIFIFHFYNDFLQIMLGSHLIDVFCGHAELLQQIPAFRTAEMNIAGNRNRMICPGPT